jgi:hypothetical protein
MAWTAFPTWSVGQVSLASDWNTYVAGNSNFLATPPVLRVYRSGALSTTAALAQLIPYDTVQEDSQLGFNTGTSLYTVKVAGEYLVSAAIAIEFGTDLNYLTAYVYQNPNGTGNVPIEMGACELSASGIGLTARAIGLARCSVGDTLSGYYDASAAWTVNGNVYATTMRIVKVSN